MHVPGGPPCQKDVLLALGIQDLICEHTFQGESISQWVHLVNMQDFDLFMLHIHSK